MDEELVPYQMALPVHAGISFHGPLEAFLLNELDSVHSRRAYRRHIRAAFKILRVESVSAVTANALVNYREVLLSDGRGAATHAQALYAMRSFLDWCFDMGGLTFPARTMERLLRVPKVEVLKPYVTITKAEALRLIQAGRTLRDQALLLVMLGGGLRVSEVSNLDCTDLVEVDGEPVIWVRKGKGNKDRLVPVTSEVSEAIHVYLQEDERLVETSGPLFLAVDRGLKVREQDGGDGRLTHWGIRKVLKGLVVQVSIAKRVTPHALRHTFGMEFQRKGGDLTKTAKVMGHKTIQPTIRYTDHLELAELRPLLTRWCQDKNEPP
jgi:integrase/recombinase XerC